MTKSEHHKLHYIHFEKNSKGQIIKSKYSEKNL